MPTQSRREILALAALMGAGVAWPALARAPRRAGSRPDRVLREDRTAYPQGVASADPAFDSVLLWTRRAPAEGLEATSLTVEVAEDEEFSRIVASGSETVDASSDWTCRILATGLMPDRPYWYRFHDEHGRASRVGRTFTAPADDDDCELHFAFVSCQNVNMGQSLPYRRMIAEDRVRLAAEQLRFVLHLGDFIYEMVFYPENRADGRLQGRSLRGGVRMPGGERIGDYHVPRDVADYRAIYRAYLDDPDLQDARARWPFVCVWDNHEFSNRGWQSVAVYDRARAAQRLRVAANQAWFEYVPARVRQPGRGAVNRFQAPAVDDVAIAEPQREHAAREPNNLAAINSLHIFRALRWGRHVELILTDTRSFRSQPVFEASFAAPFRTGKLPYFAPQRIVEILDAGKTHGGGAPPATIAYEEADLPNPTLSAEPGSMLGRDQKRWFVDTLTRSAATWKLWGNSVAMTDVRADPFNLPHPHAGCCPGGDFAITNTHDWGGYPTERAELLLAAERAGVTNLVSLAGDRHAFFAGTVSPALPPAAFRPLAAEFVVGSICTPTLAEASVAAIPATHPLRALYLQGGGSRPRPAMNVTVRHGVASSLRLAEGADPAAALAARNPDVAPHLAFADLAGHGFATVHVTAAALTVTFVAMPPPLDAADDRVLYRVTHRLGGWKPGEAPRIERVAAEGSALAERYLDWDSLG